VIVHQTVVVGRFLEAGADVIETATYQASVDGICRHLSVAPSEALDVIAKAVAIAREARDEFWENHVKKGKFCYKVTYQS